MAINYQPVVHADSGPYRGAALVGTHSAVIGWTFDDLALRDNFSENAFNYQTNVAMIVRDPGAVRHFENYFQALTHNPPKSDSKLANREIMDQANGVADRFAEKTFFSPIKKKDILETSVELIRSARSAVLTSAPFGVDKTMIQALQANSGDIIEYGLVNAAAKKKIKLLQRHNTRFFSPNRLKTYMGRKWDAKAFGAHKIHAKTIVVDPWGENPKVLIGSDESNQGE